MNRDEFIDAYMRASDIGQVFRTPEGFMLPDGLGMRAEPCDCGDEDCRGWQMVDITPVSVPAAREGGR